MSNIQLIATCPMGLEAVVAREIKSLGYTEMRVENGRVVFIGDELAICRANLWLRTADRVLIKVGEFTAHTFDELFEGTKALPWPDWIPENAEFPVQGRSYKSQLSSVPACQGIVKKAVVEKMKSRYHTEWFEEVGPKYVIEVSLMNDIATLTLDTTGYSLHKRGYRKQATEAPIKETLAAAMILLSRWTPDRPFYDPFCGSGTIPVEAAMIGWNIAPGLRRSFPSERWSTILPKHWEDARNEAYDAVKDDFPLEINGSDIDPAAIEIAEASAKSAGLEKAMKFETRAVAKARPVGDYGCLITNPPYGERLGDKDDATIALHGLGSLVIHLSTWSVFVLTPSKQVEHYMGRPANKKRKLYNGRIECDYYQFFGKGSLYSASRERDKE
ncbi:MAG: class I SAM-dependent RNA methyltransferase [Gorillibacterium sp.]|nr:class I SAM-dependent RNA methyltransferase [Gorillibacterium sp.]